jgi:nicotinic acid phosphoribosyltransferase
LIEINDRRGRGRQQSRMFEQSLLLTDLYELAMLDAYAAHGMAETASFELFVRKLPATRGFLMAAGLEQLVEFLETMRFTPDEIAWLHSAAGFSLGFLDSLAELRFTGDVDAMPEGSVFFPKESMLRVTAPLPQAQLVETRLMNLVHFQTVIASKAARVVLAVALVGEEVHGEPLLRPAMRGGRRVAGFPGLEAARAHAAGAMSRLPQALRRLEPAAVQVEISRGIRDLVARMDQADAAERRP